jgi:hypothetical protein
MITMDGHDGPWASPPSGPATFQQSPDRIGLAIFADAKARQAPSRDAPKASPLGWTAFWNGMQGFMGQGFAFGRAPWSRADKAPKTPMDLLLDLDCAALPAEARPDLPATGRLRFYACHDILKLQHEGLQWWAVRYEPVAPNPPLDGAPLLRPFLSRQRPSISAVDEGPPPIPGDYGKIRQMLDDRDRYEAIKRQTAAVMDAWATQTRNILTGVGHDQPDGPRPIPQLLGHAVPVGDDPVANAPIAAHKLGWVFPFNVRWRLLLQLPLITESPHFGVQCHGLYFVIRETDLRRRRFDKAMAVLQSPKLRFTPGPGST